MIREVFSKINADNAVFRDPCYEWEEECAKYLSIQLTRVVDTSTQPALGGDTRTLKTLVKQSLRKILPLPYYLMHRIKWIRNTPPLSQDINSDLSLCFVMFVGELSEYIGKNCLPVFIDVWTKDELSDIVRRTKDFKIFYVTSRDIYNRVKAKAPSSNVRYMPLSIADKYHSQNFAAYRNKYIDVFMPGRGNPVLHKYMLRYADEHKNIKYVYRHSNWECKSTDGSISLKAADRAGYMNILASSRVSLLGCSGIDNAREGSNGICFVTPRFYESAVMGCALIGRYPDNQEFTELNMRKYCPNITSYEQFCEALEHALAQTPEELYAQNHDFIINSLTSKRAEQILHDLEALTCRNS